MFSRRFEYLCAQSQDSRVTFVNGKWVGKDPLEAAARQGGSGFGSCENTWEWLQTQGQQGWELVSVTTEAMPGGNLTRLYLKRELL